MGSDQRWCQARLAQRVEHQTKDLAVAGSTPVPTPQAENLLHGMESIPSSPKAADVCAIGRRHGQAYCSSGLSNNRPSGGSCDEPAAIVLPWRGSTAECHVVRGYRFHRLPASGSGCLATRDWGYCPAAKSLDETAANRRARGGSNTLRTRTCDRLTFRRPTAFSRQ